MNKIENSTILVTGGAGFIGSHVVDELVNQGHTVYAADRNLEWAKNSKAIYHPLDILNYTRVDQLFETIRPDVTIHLAGILGTSETWNHVQECVDSNITGAINVYEACAKYKSDILTVDVGSRWLAPYTISKRTGAEFAFAYGNKYGIKAGALRIFNVYGPRQGTKIIKIIPKFIENALKGVNLEVWGNKNADLVHVKDVARAFASAVNNLEKIDQNDNVFIGSGEIMTVGEVADLIVKKIGKGTVVHMKPRVGEEKAEAGFMNNNVAFELLGWKPEINLEDGLNECIEWYKKIFGYIKN